MYFIRRMPRTMKQHETITVVVEILSKAAHFIPTKFKFEVVKIVEFFITEISRLYMMPTTIILERDSQFTSNSWKGWFE